MSKAKRQWIAGRPKQRRELAANKAKGEGGIPDAAADAARRRALAGKIKVKADKSPAN